MIKHSKFVKKDYNIQFSADGQSFTLLNGEINLYSYSSLGLASAITAYARIGINEVKLKLSKDHPDSLLYSDTDSLFCKSPLPDDLVGPNLGQFKLVKKVSKIYIIKPKVYLTVDYDGTFDSTLAGVDFNLTPEICEKLLYPNNSHTIYSKKWIRNYALGNLEILDTTFVLKSNSFKRKPIFNANGQWVGTLPYYINTL